MAHYSLQAIDAHGYGLVWVHATEDDLLSGQPPLDRYRIQVRPAPGQALDEALTEALPTATPLRGPVVVSMRQARLALLHLGALAAVEAALAERDEADRIAWEYSTQVQRGHPLVEPLGAALGLDLEALFTLAESL